MTYQEIKGDLFKAPADFYLAHCISADYKLGAGIAVQFDKRYNMRSKLNRIGYVGFPQVLLIDDVFNLITKEKYYHKPTNFTMCAVLMDMCRICKEKEINKIAMPKIGCGLDRLQWGDVSQMIKDIFKDMDIEIRIYYQ